LASKINFLSRFLEDRPRRSAGGESGTEQERGSEEEDDAREDDEFVVPTFRIDD